MILSRREAIRQDLNNLDYLRREYSNLRSNLEYESRFCILEDYITALRIFETKWSIDVVWDEESKSHYLKEP